MKERVEVDESYIGGLEAGLRGGRQLVGKALVVAAVEVRGTASGRVRLQVVPDASSPSLTGFVKAHVEPGAIVLTDGWPAYAPLAEMGYLGGIPELQIVNPSSHQQTLSPPRSGTPPSSGTPP